MLLCFVTIVTDPSGVLFDYDIKEGVFLFQASLAILKPPRGWYPAHPLPAGE